MNTKIAPNFINTVFILGIGLIFVLEVTSCSPLIDYRQLLDRDLEPPYFEGINTSNPKTVKIIFSEVVLADKNDILIIPKPPDYSLTVKDKTISLNFAEGLLPGGSYKLKTTVKDKSGNTLMLISNFYGFNPNLPDMKINEFTTQGSSSNPDRVEIRVLSDGNTAGAILYEGDDMDWEQRKIFPAIEVKEGDYIIVHFKSTGDPGEMDETKYKDTSGGIKPSDTGWDLWVEGGTGLSGNNGTITLFTTLYGSLIDGVLYSNRTSSSDEKYRGFGSTKIMNRADRLFETGGWTAEGEAAAPEDGINPEDSTATRSMCRGSDGEDTNSKEDWHIVPTSTSSFGEINSDLVYSP